MDYPKLSSVAWYSVIAACFFATALATREKTGGWEVFHGITLFLGVVFACIAAAAGLDYILHAGTIHLYDVRRAMALTEKVRLLETWSRLSPEQTAAFGVTGINLAWVIAGLEGEAIPFVLRVPGGEVPVGFLETFVNESDAEYLIPVRRYGEGTREREYATLLTNVFIGNGWAEAARGNLPARWINKAAAEKLLDRLLA